MAKIFFLTHGDNILSVKQLVNLLRLTEITEKRKQKFMDILLQLDYFTVVVNVYCERVFVLLSFTFVLSWGCTKVDRRGKMVEDIVTKHNLCILNDSSSTYVHPATGCVGPVLEATTTAAVRPPWADLLSLSVLAILLASINEMPFSAFSC